MIRRIPFMRLLLGLAVFPLLAACQAPGEGPRKEAPKSVILLIGDGLGFPQIAYARNLALSRGERFAFEAMPFTGFVSTYAASNFTTDSGAAGTAMATGVKTHNQVVGVDAEYRPLKTVTDLAQENGWKIGYVTDTAITHATPASFYASVCNRYTQVDAIAEQLLEQGPDLAFGGGFRDFLPVHKFGRRQDTEDLLEKAVAQGYTVWREAPDLAAEADGKVLGLFAGNHLPMVVDSLRLPEPMRAPSLVQLTKRALEILGAEEEPFFLLVEGGRIDHAGHSFDAASLAPQVEAFDEAVKAVLDYQKQHPDTLVLLTADHATGGLAINDFADWESLDDQTASIDWIVAEIRDEEEPADLARVHELTGHDHITEEDRQKIQTMGDAYDAGRYLGQRLAERQGITWVPWVDSLNTAGHTGEDVPLYAQGPGAQQFAGTLDNSDIPKRLLALLGWDDPNPDQAGKEPLCEESGGSLRIR